MKKQKQAVCPGCSRHCTADAIRCKRGRAYFEKLRLKEEKGCAQETGKRMHKWEKKTEEGGVIRKLLSVSRRIKKALIGDEISEAQLMSVLNDEERKTLMELLEKLMGTAGEREKNSKKSDSEEKKKGI